VKRIQVLAVGRKGDREITRACEDYYRRCQGTLSVDQQVVRDQKDLKRALPARALLVALDQRGHQLTSEQFAEQLRKWIEGPAPQIVFVVGGAEGLDDDLRQRADMLLAFGQMTFAHQLARLMLAEQIYRAASIWAGSPYHK
jgi:23S rRNA (pseudouridine1915-N3)-methyltransferase